MSLLHKKPGKPKPWHYLHCTLVEVFDFSVQFSQHFSVSASAADFLVVSILVGSFNFLTPQDENPEPSSHIPQTPVSSSCSKNNIVSLVVPVLLDGAVLSM